LQSSSCHVKLKVLKILLHTCSQGSPQFVLQLKRNANFIREAAVFSGPPDPLHGNSLNQKVRAAAQDLATILFSDAPLPQPLALPARPPAPAGMGSSPSPCGSLQGFGFSSDKSGSVSAAPPGWALGQGGRETAGKGNPECLCSLGHSLFLPQGWAPAPAPVAPCRDSASAVTKAAPVSPGRALTEVCASWDVRPAGHGRAELLWVGVPVCRGPCRAPSRSKQVAPAPTRCVPSRVDADSPGDCRRELSLVSGLMRGARVFLTREEAQHFLKECGLLNCEVVLELLGRALEDPSDSVRMRSMCAISALGCSDLLSPEQIFTVTRQRLQHLSQGSPGPVANRATKV
ncbi:AP-4 complex accessory subunit tepsin, partial [Corvus brachyrhynchos]